MLRRDRLPLLALSVLLAGVVLVGTRPAPAQDAPAAAGARFSYLTVSLTVDDTTKLLREATGLSLAGNEEMAHALERGNEPVDDPKVQAIVDRILQDKLAALGQEGWEAYEVVPHRQVVFGVLLPAPRVYLKRRAA